MRIFRSLLLIIFVHLVFVPVLAFANVQISAELSPQKIGLQDTATITLTISNAVIGLEIERPNVNGLQWVGQNQSTNVQIFNGLVQSIKTFTFTIRADAPGTYNIPGMTVIYENKRHKTQDFKLEVVSGSLGNTATPKHSPAFPNFPSYDPFFTPNPQPRSPNSQNGAPQMGREFWLASEITNANPFLREQILYKFKIYSRVQIDFDDITLPDFSDFLAEELDSGSQGREKINGIQYSTYEIVYALTPLREGPSTIPEADVSIRYFVQNPNLPAPFLNDPFFARGSQVARKVLTAPEIPIDVQALPKPIPENFTHLVGEFRAHAEVSNSQIKQGDSITYTLTLSGQGNIRDAVWPKSEFKDFQVYDDKPKTESQKNKTGVSGTKIFTRALIAQKSGDLVIPAQTLTYLNPQSKSFEELVLPEFKINVLPSATLQTPSVTSLPQKESGMAINPKSPSEGKPQHSGSIFKLVLESFLNNSESLVALIGLAMVLILKPWKLFHFVKNKMNSSPQSKIKILVKKLNAKNLSPENVFREIQNAFSEIMPASGVASSLTSEEILDFLKNKNLSEAVWSQLNQEFKKLDKARYVLSSQNYDVNPIKILMQELIKKI